MDLVRPWHVLGETFSGFDAVHGWLFFRSILHQPFCPPLNQPSADLTPYQYLHRTSSNWKPTRWCQEFSEGEVISGPRMYFLQLLLRNPKSVALHRLWWKEYCLVLPWFLLCMEINSVARRRLRLLRPCRLYWLCLLCHIALSAHCG